MKQWVEHQVAAGGFGTASEFFRHLLRLEQQRQIVQQVERNLHEALDSGESTAMTPTDWERICREGRKRVAGKRKPK